ncbi:MULTISPECIES: hypothetical protein [unclassified Kitasatospora]|uniref:hypothetical protein n=1 Tax=unclassified Kitasatospora TaxID=2633591 RepID=UPI0033ED7154
MTIARPPTDEHRFDERFPLALYRHDNGDSQPLYTALDRAGLHTLTDDDHQAVRDLTQQLDPATLRRVTSRLERTRTAALALRGTEHARPARPHVRRGGF